MQISSCNLDNLHAGKRGTAFPVYMLERSLCGWKEKIIYMMIFSFHQTNESGISPVGQSVSISKKQMKMGSEREIYSVTLTKTKNLRCIIRLQSRL